MGVVILFGIGMNQLQKVAKKEEASMAQTVNIVKQTDIVTDNRITENEELEDTKKLEKDNTNSLEETLVFDWYLEIPKINLYAPIEEGTGEEVLNRSIGHFSNTARRNGNCGLAAHNRGYRVNYFAKIKELEKGDKIYYFVDGKKYTYCVKEILIVYETDWSMLEETKDNRLTLLTCVENREEYRLCVQAVLEE